MKLLSDKETVNAEIRYIKNYEKVNGIILDFPLRGWFREDCIKQAQAKLTQGICRSHKEAEFIS